ncbi:MAG TPA: cytochrome c oxidase assembly protein [Gaiellaceae bacterium]|nr:cytochrome c oxidase assembly protein [Gaiellaceae bacterium]
MQELGIVVAGAAMLALPLRAVVRLRRRGRPDLAPWSRVALAAVAAAVWLGALTALDEPADSLLSMHMLQHLLIGDLVPLLLLLAVRGPLVVHLLPTRAAQRLTRLLVRPSVAYACWAVATAVWHVPALYDDALANERLHAFEHGTFFFGGLLVWAVLLDPARRGLLPGWRRVGYALALLASAGILGNVLVLSYRPLYPAYDNLRDQDLAGLLMMVEQALTLGGIALVTARRELRRRHPEPASAARHPLAV